MIKSYTLRCSRWQVWERNDQVSWGRMSLRIQWISAARGGKKGRFPFVTLKINWIGTDQPRWSFNTKNHVFVNFISFKTLWLVQKVMEILNLIISHYPNAFSSLNGLERKVFSLKSTFWGTSVSMVVLFEIIVIRFGAISWKWSVWGPKGPTTTRSEQRKATPIWALFSGGLFNWSKNLFANWSLF